MITTSKTKHKIKLRYKLCNIALAIIIIYLICVYSNIPFIAKWRTLYIETAMSTMTHQWLATSFIPSSVINKVMDDAAMQQKENLIDENSKAAPTHEILTVEYLLDMSEEEVAELKFTQVYPEIDRSTLPNNLAYRNMYYNINFEEHKNLNIRTLQGDKVEVLDTINGIVIIQVKGSEYFGRLCLIKDSSKIHLAVTPKEDSGQMVVDIIDYANGNNNGVLGINASGFIDPNGHGNGGSVVGFVKSYGDELNAQEYGGTWFTCGYDYDDNLRIGTKLKLTDLRDAMQFKPALIIDGEKKVEGSAGWGIQPRTILAQDNNKQTMFLVIDGRRPGYSIGITLGDCADLLLKYGATQAINMDGGSSSALAYMGKTINRPSTGSSQNGRYVPNAWIVEGIHINEEQVINGRFTEVNEKAHGFTPEVNMSR